MQQPEDMPNEPPMENSANAVDASVDSFISVALIVLTLILAVVPFGFIFTPATIYGAIRYHQSAKKKATSATSQSNASGTMLPPKTSRPAGMNAPVITIILILVGGAAFMNLLVGGLT